MHGKRLQEGAGHAVMSAFVELVFDNQDNRIPVDRDEVRLRRTIGLKKDEYFLDKKHITKTEVMNLLESAGFSRSNPYYVVQQGKIMSMANMKDSERLDLLKEIGGTNVYEERRKDSLKILEDTVNKRAQINEVISYIEERLKELDEERDELAKYQQLDKQRRSLEYAIYDQELQDARKKLDETENRRQAAAEQSGKLYEEMRDAQSRLARITKEMEDLSDNREGLVEERNLLAQEKKDAIKRKAYKELDVKEMEERFGSSSNAVSQVAEELEKLAAQIQETNKKLESVTPQVEKEKEEQGRIENNIAAMETRLSTLYQKQGRASQFSSMQERDQWLSKELSELEKAHTKSAKQAKLLEEQMQQLQEDLEEEASSLKDRTDAIQQRKQHIENTVQEVVKLKQKRDKLTDERKELWRADAEADRDLEKHKAELSRCERQLELAMPRDINRGLMFVRKVVKQRNIKGVHGALIELFSCNSRFSTAVEVTAGNSLFHVVVDSDEVASQIIKHLNEEKGGRVSFLPLNRLSSKVPDYPKDYGTDVLPMINKLKFDEKFKPAMLQVFGKTLICRDLDVGTNVARTTQLNCVTLEGDQVSKRGSLTGGYHDTRTSRIEAMKLIKELSEQQATLKAQTDKAQASVQRLDQEISQILGEIQKLEAKRVHMKDATEELEKDLHRLQDNQQHSRKQLEQKQQQHTSITNSLSQIQANMDSLRSEFGSDMKSTLTTAEAKELSTLNSELPALRSRLVECKTRALEKETEKQELEALLSTNLLKRQKELESMAGPFGQEEAAELIEQKRAELNAAVALVEDLAQKQSALDSRIEEVQKKLEDLGTEQEKLQGYEDHEERIIQDEMKIMEQLMARRNMLMQKRDELQRKIRDLGSLPSDAFEKYRGKRSKELHGLLQRCNNELKEYGHVNKKALDQYVNFTEQREELNKRQGELDKSDQKIRELIEVLDHRKDEAIERTFKGVAKNFKEVFSELVPGGVGQLVMQKKRRADDADVEQDLEGTGQDPGTRNEKYCGVKVKVKFASGTETISINQLSGGQKTVVALAMIFAIQRCDPAPFYLFDEIDAALDPAYRTAVGAMIKKQSMDERIQTQFICTTFRPELVKVADKVFGVSHKNRISQVDVVEKEDALAFIEEDEPEKSA